MNDLELKYYAHPKMQEKFREAMGIPIAGDRLYMDRQGLGIYHSNGLVYFQITAYAFRLIDERFIRLPLPIDPVNPERGLWSMVDWEKFFVRIRNSGKINIQYQDFVVEDYPTLALLKALAYQWGVEI